MSIKKLIDAPIPFHPVNGMPNLAGSGELYSIGISLRAWFAGLALQGLLASGEYTPTDCVAIAVDKADALLAELAKEVAK